MLKRVSAVLLAVAMMFTMVCTISVAHAEDVANLVVVANKETVKRGEDVTFTVSIETDETELSGLIIDVEADSNLVYKSQAAVKTDEMPYEAEGTKFAWATGDGELNFTGALCTYTYTAKADAVLGNASVTVEALEACYDTATDSIDVTVAAGTDSVAIECKHDFTGAEWARPAAGTAKEDAQHSRECIYDDCHETEKQDCSFVKNGDDTKHTQDQPGAEHWICEVCGYTCDTPIPAGHDTVTRYIAATATVDGKWQEYCTICEEEISYTIITAGHPANDVTDPNHWSYAHIAYAKAAGLMGGDNNGNFNPNNNISRAELAVVLANLYYGVGNVPAYDPNGIVFADSTTHWAKGYIQAIATAGLTAGYNEGGVKKFKPENKITTTEIIIMFKALCEKKGLGNYQFNPAVTYADANDADGWAQNYIQWSASTGFMTGDTAGKLYPKANYTRVRVAVLLRNFDKAMRGVVEVTE